MPETSFSRIKVARRCWAAHDYKYNQRLRRKRKAPPLLRGEILHEMLDAKATEMDPYERLKEYSIKYKREIQENPELYGETFLEDIGRVYDGYERAYRSDPLEIIGSEEFIATDISRDIRFVGYIDKRVKDKDGRTWMMEHKSHRYIPDADARFSDIQTVLYVWAWNTEYPSRAIDGIIWDYLRAKPPTVPDVLKSGQLSQAKNIDTDYYTYVTEIRKHQLDPRLYQETLDRLKKQGHEKFYQRIRLPTPSKTLIKSVVDDARDTAVMIERLGKDLKTRNMTRDCSRTCEFYDLCQAELRGLDANFVKKTKYEVKESSAHGFENSEDE